jgi:hypothetical protein
MSCGACEINLLCYTGRLRMGRICPLCNRFDVLANNQRWSIHCCKRYCTRQTKKKWLNEYSLLIQNRLGTYIRVEDNGPLQTYSVIHAGLYMCLYVRLCTNCHTRLKEKNEKQQCKELIQMLKDT